MLRIDPECASCITSEKGVRRNRRVKRFLKCESQDLTIQILSSVMASSSLFSKLVRKYNTSNENKSDKRILLSNLGIKRMG